MKLRSLFLLTFAAMFALVLPSRSHALDVSFSFFHESLAPHGEWLEVGDYGYCWRPTGVDADWAPYSDGYWAYTDGGWTWVSYEEFGGIVYHYGRWARVEDEGWCWKPDYEWAPAWVSWRNNDSHVGWAPLPPEARWERNRGFSVWVDHSYDIAPSCYNFVRTVDFGAPVLRPLLCNRRENFGYIQNTVNVTNVTYNTGAGVIFNGGPNYVDINRRVNRQIPALKLVQNTNITVVNNTVINNNVRVKNVNAVQQGNQLVVVAPNVIRPEAAQVTALVKPNVKRVIPQSRVTKGWGAVPADQRTAIRTKFKQETKDLTPETAPARPMKVADVQAVPEKADPDAPSPTAIRKDRPRTGVPNREKVTAERDPATVPTTEAPSAVEKPVDPRDAAKIAREKALRQKTTPEPQPAEVATSPTPADPAARERVKPTRPEVVKPFAPATTNEQPATVKTPDAVEAPPKRTAAQQNAEGRERAAAAAREKAAAQQEAIRQRQSAQQAQDAAKERATAQQQQEIIRQRQMDGQAQETARQRSSEAAQDRQKMIQQQQEQNAARARASEQQEALRQRQSVQQSQEAAQERAAQSAAQRQRAVESQQQQQAAQARAAQVNEGRQRAAEQQSNAARQQAAERAQMQNAARAQAAQQQQAQSAAREQAIARAQAQNAARQQAPPPQRQVAQPQPQAQPRQAPAQRGGKRQLTPEEAEALKQRQR